MSKSIIKLVGPLSELLIRAYGKELEAQIVNACQSRLNEGKGTEEATKRGPMRGGQSFGEDGTIKKVKSLTWTEQTPTEYELPMDYANGKVNLPAEFVKFNDGLVNLFKKVGFPSGELSVGTIPTPLVAWINDMVARRAEKETAKQKTEVVATKNHRGTKPATNGQSEAVKV